MPTVICDTSPLQYLHQTGYLALLPTLFGEVVVPQSVVNELAEGRRLGVSLPIPEQLPWVSIVASQSAALPLAWDLGAGEREMLALALTIAGALAISDDRLARKAAKFLGIPLIGTLGLLLKAKQRGHVPEIRPILDQFQALGFFLDPRTRRDVLSRAGEQ